MTVDKVYDQVDFKLSIINLPLNRYGCDRVAVKNTIIEFAEKMEELGADVVEVKMKGDDE